jgi:LysM repeat protein
MRIKSTLLRITALTTLLLTIFAHPVGPVLAQEAGIRVMPGAPTIGVNQTVVVSITIANVTNLYAAEFHMQFDPSIVEVVDANTGTAGVQIAAGSFLSPDIIAQNQANNAVGTIDFAISQSSPSAPVSGNGTLATITFRARATGSSPIAFTSVTLSNNVGATIAVADQNGVITVATTAPAATATAPAPTATAPAATATAPAPTATVAPSTPTGTPVPATPTPTAAPRTPTPVATPRAPTTGIQGYHTVRSGETLFSIGRAYATQPDAIARQNGIVNTSRIFVGTRLGIPVAPWSRIPAGPVAARQFTPGGTAPAPTPAPSPAPATCRFYHTVQRGNTLTAIAIRYGTNIWAISRANNIANVNLIFAGQVLCIP